METMFQSILEIFIIIKPELLCVCEWMFIRTMWNLHVERH